MKYRDFNGASRHTTPNLLPVARPTDEQAPWKKKRLSRLSTKFGWRKRKTIGGKKSFPQITDVSAIVSRDVLRLYKVNHRPSWPVWSKAPTISWNDGDPSYTPARIAYPNPVSADNREPSVLQWMRRRTSLQFNRSQYEPVVSTTAVSRPEGVAFTFFPPTPLPFPCSASQVAKRFFLLGMSGMRWTSRGSANSQVLRFRSAYSHFDKPDYGITPLDCKRKMVVWVIHYQRRV